MANHFQSLGSIIMGASKFSRDLLRRLTLTFPRWVSLHTSLLDQSFLVLLASFLHLWRIDTPNALVFDEVYFSVYANNYLEGIPFFDSHPPLGKYLIALGIRFFGFVPLGYRCVDALFGIAVVVLIYRLAKLLFEDRRVGFLAGLFAALDGVLLVESRAGLINTFAVFFSLGGYYLFLRAGTEKLERPQWVYLLGAGICVGAGIAVKWIGAASLGVIFFLYLLSKAAQQPRIIQRIIPQSGTLQRLGKIHPDLFLTCFLIVPIAVYSASFIIHLNQNPEYQFFELQRQFFGYHAHLQAQHGYASTWLTWPLLIRPVSYYWQHDHTSQTVSTILNLGNPGVWWFAIPAVLAGLWYAIVRRHLGALFAIVAIACHYLPFSMISRVSYLYHFMGALPFTIILLAFSVFQLWRSKGWRREVAAIVVISIIACAIYFYPVWTALPMPVGAYYQRMWFLSWI